MIPNPGLGDLEPLAGALADATQGFDAERTALLAPHGIEPGSGDDFVLRLRQTGGRLAPGQFLALDDIADRYGDGAVHLTPRQGIAVAGVLKRDLKEAIGALHLAGLTTFGASGAVARVVVAAPRRTPAHRRLEETALRLSDRLLPSRRAYDALWLDGERAAADGRDGAGDLPRLLEIGLALPEDDAIDVLSSDVAIIALDDGERLHGYNIALGGVPRRAAPVAFIAPEELLDAVAVALRLERGGDARIASKLASAWGQALPPPRTMPQFLVQNHRGWHAQGDGRLYLGVAVPGSRIADRPTGVRLRSALRLICRDFGSDVLVTPRQDVILANISPGDRLAIETALARLGVARAERAPRADAHLLKEAS